MILIDRQMKRTKDTKQTSGSRDQVKPASVFFFAICVCDQSHLSGQTIENSITQRRKSRLMEILVKAINQTRLNKSVQIFFLGTFYSFEPESESECESDGSQCTHKHAVDVIEYDQFESLYTELVISLPAAIKLKNLLPYCLCVHKRLK